MAKRNKSEQTKLKDKLWKLTSEYVRRKYADSRGYVACYTCGNTRHWKGEGMQAGHAIGGRTNQVLFDLEILRPQCPSCNGPVERGNYYIFGKKLNEENGEGWYEQKKIEAGKPKKYYLSDYEEMVEAIEEMLKNLDN